MNSSRELSAPGSVPEKVKFGRPQGRSVLRSLRRHIGSMLSAMPRQLLRVTLIRFLICAFRYAWYVLLLRRTRTFDPGTGDVAPNTVAHNMRGMFDLAVERSLRLIQPLTALETLRDRIGEVRVLSIGARTEGELYNLYSYGFRKRNVTAIDLISYSPRVRLGDMHNLDLPDDSFDTTIVGWVLAYSDNRAKAVSEIVRVTRPGGVIAIGVEWLRASVAEISEELGYTPASATRLDSMDALVALFRDHIEHIYFQQDERLHEPDREVGDLLLVFRTRK